MEKSLAAYTAAVALVALAMFAPTKATAQVNIYVGPGGYAQRRDHSGDDRARQPTQSRRLSAYASALSPYESDAAPM